MRAQIPTEINNFYDFISKDVFTVNKNLANYTKKNKYRESDMKRFEIENITELGRSHLFSDLGNQGKKRFTVV
jgi:hypothetical protein